MGLVKFTTDADIFVIFSQVTRDSWRYGESQSQPPSPGYTEGGYHHTHSSGLYLTDSPLLSQSATSLNIGQCHMMMMMMMMMMMSPPAFRS